MPEKNDCYTLRLALSSAPVREVTGNRLGNVPVLLATPGGLGSKSGETRNPGSVRWPFLDSSFPAVQINCRCSLSAAMRYRRWALSVLACQLLSSCQTLRTDTTCWPAPLFQSRTILLDDVCPPLPYGSPNIMLTNDALGEAPASLVPSRVITQRLPNCFVGKSFLVVPARQLSRG